MKNNLMVLFVLLICFFSFSLVRAEILDVTAPGINSITMEKTSVVPGE